MQVSERRRTDDRRTDGRTDDAVYALGSEWLTAARLSRHLRRDSVCTRTASDRGVDPYGTEGTRPPNISTGGKLSRMSPSIFLG